MPHRVLILGGTREARQLAQELLDRGVDVITSLAGVTEQPVLPPGALRMGGFGGVDGVAEYVAKVAISVVVDATHPFAARISAHAHEACRRTGVPLFRLERPAWVAGPGDDWTALDSIAEAAAALPPGARVLLTIGRKETAPFFGRADLSGVARMIEAPPEDPPPGWRIRRERPPFTPAAERALLSGEAITHLVTKNAGGPATAAKLEAARELGIPVFMIRRPAKPETRSFATPTALARAVEGVLCP